MSVFNNYGKYNAEEEAIRRAALVEEFLDKDVERVLLIDEINEESENESKT